MTRRGSLEYAMEICKYFKSLDAEYLFSKSIDAPTSLNAQYIKTYSGPGLTFLWRTISIFFKAPEIISNYKKQTSKKLVIYFPVFHVWNIIWVFWANRMGVEVFNTIHDFITHKGEQQPIVEWLQKSVITNSKVNIFLSHFTLGQARSFKALKQSKIFILPHPILATTAQHELRYNKNLSVLFLGRAVEYKGIALLIEASKNLALERVTIAGLNSSKFEISDTKFNFIDKYLDKNEIAELLNSHHILVLPYIEATQSGVLSLGISAEIAMIVSRVGGLTEQINDDSVIWVEPNAESLRQGLESLIYDPKKYNILKKNLDIFKMKFQQDWEEKFNELLNFDYSSSSCMQDQFYQ